MAKAKIADIFLGRQGEGIYAGRVQIFVRFYGCQLSCRFCDTRLSAFDKYTPLELYQRVKEFISPFQFGEKGYMAEGRGELKAYHSLCLTGGEPLLQKDFLKQFLRLIKYEGIPTYLETNGILADEISELIEDIDIIAMDIKLPTSTGGSAYWSEHSRFLKIVLRKKVFIKMVICSTTERRDIDEALRVILKARAKRVPVVLQPNFFELSKELLARTRMLQRHCSRYLFRVKVIPQLHKLTSPI